MNSHFLAAHLAALVYDDKIHSSLITSETNHKHMKYRANEKEGTEFNVYRHDNTLVISIRGTTDIKDWLANLDVRFSATEYGKLHHGFHDNVKVIFDELHNDIAEYEKFKLIGHSKGGAEATALAALIKFHHPFSTVKVETFGAPAVGDRNFIQYFDFHIDECFRWYHWLDPVPKALKKAGLKHPKGGNILFTPFFIRPIKAHSMTNYINNMEM